MFPSGVNTVTAVLLQQSNSFGPAATERGTRVNVITAQQFGSPAPKMCRTPSCTLQLGGQHRVLADTDYIPIQHPALLLLKAHGLIEGFS